VTSSVLQASACCKRNESIPAEVDHFIPELAAPEAKSPPQQKGLVYPIVNLVAVAVHGGASPLPVKQGPKRRRRRHRCHRSPSALPAASSPQQAQVRSMLGPSAASMGPGPTTHHVHACSAPRDLMATSPEDSTSAADASHPSVPKETKPSVCNGAAKSRCSTVGD
jgi:hypothetical protein